MHIAILSSDGYNELDSIIALGILNRVKRPDWRVSIASPTTSVRSMNGAVIERQATIEEAAEADAVIIGSGMQTREVMADASLMARLRLDRQRQRWLVPSVQAPWCWPSWGCWRVFMPAPT